MKSACPIAFLVASIALLAADAQAQTNSAPPLPPPKPSAEAAKPAADAAKVDLAYGAFQRGFYLTALAEATKRAEQNDRAAMTLIGQIYAQGLGVGRNDAEAVKWF